MPLPSTTDEQIHNAIERFVEVKRLKVGDNVVVSAGVPAGRPGNTNLILIQKVEPQG
jgi:pyruvate kinase